jgi:NADH dehydrogenase/NADH:ubiquinone oxidoreductase subunit G
MQEITLNIDGLEFAAKKGASILQVALSNGIYIPHLCYHPELEPLGACRLCIVEVSNGGLVPSCRMPVAQGMVVRTNSPRVESARRAIVELLIADHHTDCRSCPASGRCQLQQIMARLRISVKRMRPLRWAKEKLPQDTCHPLFDYDPNRCVLCGICVETCEGIQEFRPIHFVGRGYSTRIGFFGDKSRCESCKECVTRCPVGALLPKYTST